MTVELERYKRETGKIPDNLTQLNANIKINGLTYSTNTDHTTLQD